MHARLRFFQNARTSLEWSRRAPERSRMAVMAASAAAGMLADAAAPSAAADTRCAGGWQPLRPLGVPQTAHRQPSSACGGGGAATAAQAQRAQKVASQVRMA